MIRIGGSVGCRFSRPIIGTTCFEARILQNSEHKFFWVDSQFCITNKIYLIVNIDTFLTGSRWLPTSQALRDFVIATKNQLKSIGATKTNCRFTWDNESNEYCGFDYYWSCLAVIHDALGSEFDLGAGNFHTTRIDWYNSLGNKYSQGYYEVLDVHFQDGMDNESNIDFIAGKFKAIKDGFGIKRIAVTEGNNFWNVSTQRGHDLVKYQINTAENIGCEDFCFPFVNWTSNNVERHKNLTYCIDGNPIKDSNDNVLPFWQDMLNLILAKKPIITEELDDMKLQILKIGVNSNQVLWLQEILKLEYGFANPLLDGRFGSMTDKQVKEYQTANNLLVDGKVGKATTVDLIEKSADPAKWLRKLQILVAFE
uniref:Putative peptidoglycan binding protein n=1 Tax=viral metagenome TaxID=1070528 RepID=A0A6H1ZE06_9ZZZZ